MKNRLPLFMFLGLGVAVAALLVPGAVRYYALRRVLAAPGAAERLAVRPGERVLPPVSAGKPVNLGYATFALDLPGAPKATVAGEGTCVKLWWEDRMLLTFFCPYAPAGPAPGAGASRLAAHRQREESDPVGALREVEDMVPPALGQVLFMGRERFAYTAALLAKKVGRRIGSEEVYFVTAPQVRGAVFVGHAPRDRRGAYVVLASADGTRILHFCVGIADSAGGDVGPVVDQILGSFRFTVEKIEGLEQVQRLIAEAGIQERAQ